MSATAMLTNAKATMSSRPFRPLTPAASHSVLAALGELTPQLTEPYWKPHDHVASEVASVDIRIEGRASPHRLLEPVDFLCSAWLLHEAQYRELIVRGIRICIIPVS
jgi:hypothetical protein